MNFLQEQQIDRLCEEPIANTIVQYPHHSYPHLVNYFVPCSAAPFQIRFEHHLPQAISGCLLDDYPEEGGFDSAANNWCQVTVQSVPQNKHRQFIWDFKLSIEQNVQAILDQNSFVEELNQADFEVFALLPDIKASGGQTRVNMRELLACFLELTIKSARRLFIAKTTYVQQCMSTISGNRPDKLQAIQKVSPSDQGPLQNAGKVQTITDHIYAGSRQQDVEEASYYLGDIESTRPKPSFQKQSENIMNITSPPNFDQILDQQNLDQSIHSIPCESQVHQEEQKSYDHHNLDESLNLDDYVDAQSSIMISGVKQQPLPSASFTLSMIMPRLSASVSNSDSMSFSELLKHDNSACKPKSCCFRKPSSHSHQIQKRKTSTQILHQKRSCLNNQHLEGGVSGFESGVKVNCSPILEPREQPERDQEVILMDNDYVQGEKIFVSSIRDTVFHGEEQFRRGFIEPLQRLAGDERDIAYHNTKTYLKVICKDCKKFQIWFTRNGDNIQFNRLVNCKHDKQKHKMVNLLLDTQHQ
ncbi:hypothetical protein FGO68_gene15833 [Halteria grandinella]|uniref:Uncharacterized protein n=1 Tax=Halteria grandinella TaxID=5974 RepID=A0A8J8NXF7_HALGN|nr:hypothetical protein FGO68_gene15833 [Halteria grandinella]